MFHFANQTADPRSCLLSTFPWTSTYLSRPSAVLEQLYIPSTIRLDEFAAGCGGKELRKAEIGYRYNGG